MIAMSAPEGELVRDGAVLLTFTGVPSALFNAAFLFEVGDRAPEVIDAALAFLGDRGVPFGLLISERREPLAAALTREAGFVAGVRLPGMVLEDFSALPPEHVAPIERVRSDFRYDDFTIVTCEGFEIPEHLAQTLFSPALMDTEGCEVYVGYVDGAPAVSGVLVRSDGVAGVYNIATRPQYRGRGLGEAMSWHVVRRGLATGCDIAVLQASGAGLPIYERMGFRHLDDYTVFTLPERDEASSEASGASPSEVV